MDRIKTLLQFQWRAYWRRFHGAGNLRASNVGPLVVVGGLVVVRYLQQLPIAATQLAKGETARYETLLLVVFLAWLLPVMGESRRSISSHGLFHFPLTVKDLFLIRLSSVFCSPISWIVVAVSLALGYPVSVAQHPVTGTAALLLLLLLGLFTSLAFTHLLNIRWARRVSVAVLLVASAVATLLWLGKRSDLFAPPVKWLSPIQLTVAAAVSSTPLRSLAVLAALTVLVGFFAMQTFARTLQPQSDRRSQSFLFFGSGQLPGRFGGLLKKDLRYSTRLLDLYLALPIVVFLNMYLTSDTAPSANVLFVIMAVLFLPCTSLVFNCFGLESPLGLDRYTLLPLSGKEKLLSKNLAFATVMLAFFVTILPLTFWKLGTRASFVGFVELMILILAYVCYGNWMSVKEPFRMHFYRFASGGSFVDVVMGILFGSVPAGVTVYVLYNDDTGAYWKLALMLLIYLVFFLFSISRSARVLENRREEIRHALS